MKKVILVILISAIVFSFVACHQQYEAKTSGTDTSLNAESSGAVEVESETVESKTVETETVESSGKETETRDPNTPDWVNDFMYENHQFVSFQSIEDISKYVSSVYSGTEEYRKYIVPTKNPVSNNLAKTIASNIISTPIVRVKEGIEHEQLWLQCTVNKAYPSRYMSYVYVIDGIQYTFRFYYYNSEPPFEPSTPSLGEVKVGPHTFDLYRNFKTIRGAIYIGGVDYSLSITTYDPAAEELDGDVTLLHFAAFELFTMAKDGTLSEYVYEEPPNGEETRPHEDYTQE